MSDTEDRERRDQPADQTRQQELREQQQHEDERRGREIEKLARWERDHERGWDP